MIRRKRTLKGVRFSTRGSSTGSNTLGSTATDSQSTGDETLTQSAEEVPTTPVETTKGTKRKRGPTNIKDIWNLQPGTCIVVDANQYGQPIGMEASKLAEFLGTIARTGSICALNTKHWKHLSKYVLENILRIVHEKFDLQGKMEDSDILSHVGKLRNEFKSTLKTRYYKEMVQEGRSIEEIYENNPSGVHDDQWKWLVDRWGTPQAAAEKEGRESSRLEQFRFQHLRKDGSDNFSSDAAEQVYDEACKMVKDSMPIPKSSSTPQDNVAIENEVYTQVFGPDKNGKMLGYGRGMTKSRLFGYGSVTRGIQSVSAINTLIEEMNAKHVEQIQTIQAEQAVREKTLLEEAESRFRTEVAEREAHLIAEAEERFMKLTEIREAKFMDMLDAREKNYEALINE
ncbi:hypothetical protein ES319_A01G205900v1 [Gossypium barbadense]|uniref:Uncharacterized protein n=2 Tax=Gossypium barbadense TaxID=3634 RepID=A0A5J5X110_GOSBA|nr:hypothetical protein ES319_A01G205900v1 [Gossypium barbadense]KAB2097955.1 hypothetical protein ES319_A01G205900v1 [Gossypium barbadense]